MKTIPNLLTVKQFSQKYPAFSENSIRYLIFHEGANGMSFVLKRIGRKILIQEDAFFRWVEGIQPTSKE